MIRKGMIVAAVLALCAAAAWADHDEATGLDVNGQCVGDVDGDAVVGINEIIQAVNNTLGGCPQRPVELQFRGMLGDAEFACGTTYEGIGTASSQFIPSDFRFYVADVHLITPAGDEVPVTLEQDGQWQYQDVALLDFENGSGPCSAFGNEATNTLVRGSVPAGVYTGVSFTLGLPFELNHGDASTAPAPLNNTAMFWNWQFGYKFVRIDTADDKFRIHLGSTGCEAPAPTRPPTACEHPNRAEISLSGFDPDRSVIIADLEALLAESNVDSNDPETPPGCMSGSDDADCTPLFANFGLTPEGQPDDHQHFFRVGAPPAHGAHSAVRIASASDGGGALVPVPDFENPWELPFSECLGGSGEECTGGVRVYTDTNPGFSPVAEDDLELGNYALDAGVPVTLEVVSIAEGLTIKVGSAILDSAGDTLALGTSPEIHTHPEYLLAIPAAEEPAAAYDVTLRFTTTAPQHSASEEFTVSLAPGEAHGGGHH